MTEDEIREAIVLALLDELKSAPIGEELRLGSLVESSPALKDADDGIELLTEGVRIDCWDVEDVADDLFERAKENGLYVHEDDCWHRKLYRLAKPWKVSKDMKIAAFEFGESGFLGPAQTLVYDGDQLRFTELDMDRRTRRTLELVVSDRDRRHIDELFERCKVFTWDRVYHELILDGTQ